MATLQWQPINTPNFNGSLDGLRLFGNMIGNATSGLTDALGNFQKAQQVDAQQRAMTNAMGYTDPVAYQTALANGQVTSGVDPSLLTPAALEALQGRTGKLTSDAVALTGLQKDQFNFDRLRTDTATRDAARPQIANMIQTATGTALPPEVAALPTNDLVNLMTNNQSMERTNITTSTLRKEAELADQKRQAQVAADTAAVNDFPGIINADAARKYLVNSSLPVEAKKLVQSRLETQFGPLFGPVTGVPGTTTTTTAGTTAVAPSGSAAAPAMLSNAVASLGIDKIFDVGVLGQESGYKQTNADGTPLTSPKGATGIAQVMPATGPEAAKLAGLPWDENKFKTDKDYNAALGKAYFNKQVADFGDPQKALAAYNAGPGAMRAAEKKAAEAGTPNDWLKFLPEETQKYVPGVLNRLGSDPAAVLAAAAQPTQPAPTQRSLGAAADALGLAAIQNSGGNFYMNRLADAAKKNMSPGEALKSLMDGDFAGGNPRVVLDALNRTIREADVTPAVAAEMVRQSLDISRFDGAMPSWLGGGGRSINQDALDAEIKRWKSPGGPRDVLATGRDITLTGQELATAVTALDTAKADLAAVKKRAETVPSVAAQIPLFEAEVAKKQAAVLLAQSAIQTRNMQGNVSRAPVQEADQITSVPLKKTGKPTEISTATGNPQAIRQQLNEARNRAARLPPASPERAAAVREVNLLQLQLAAEGSGYTGTF